MLKSAKTAGNAGANFFLKKRTHSIKNTLSARVTSDVGMNTNTAAITPPKAETEIISTAYTPEIIALIKRSGKAARRNLVQYAIRKKA